MVSVMNLPASKVAGTGCGMVAAVAAFQSWGRSLIFDLKIKDPSDFADLYDDLDHTRGSDLIDGDLDQKITL